MMDELARTCEFVVEADGLTQQFRRKTALDGVSLRVPRGCVFGLVGENGAGKTTLIKLMLGLLTPSAGAVRVFGLDPIADPVGVLSRIGFLSEDRDLPDWMRISELIAYTKAFYPAWDDAYAEELRRTFELDPGAKIRTLSRGERAKAGLLAALPYRPPLLVLDEPSSGLDPMVRRDILTAIIRTAADEGRTVFFSSHLLDEVERVADYVAMISRSRLVWCGPLDDIKSRHTRVSIQLESPADAPPDLPGAIRHDGAGRDWTVICEAPMDAIAPAVERARARIVEAGTPSLEDLFVAKAGAARAALREA